MHVRLCVFKCRERVALTDHCVHVCVSGETAKQNCGRIPLSNVFH